MLVPPPATRQARRILVTGGSGFVGSQLVSHIRASLPPGDEVIALRGPGASSDPLSVDLSRADETTKMMVGFAPTIIVHLAAQASVGAAAANPSLVWQANFDATRNVAEAAMSLGHPVRLIFASTAEVYGRAFLQGPCDEETGLAPQSAYARSKAACEYMLRDLAGERLSVVALRLFNHTGPGQDERFVVPSFAAQLARLETGGPSSIRVGNLEAKRDFTDLADILDAYLLVLNQPEKTPGAFTVFNVGSGIQRSIRSVLDHLILCHGSPVETLADPTRQRPAEIAVAEGVFTRFSETYGWSPTRAFTQTLAAVYTHERGRR